jgi:hypothetical protein
MVGILSKTFEIAPPVGAFSLKAQEPAGWMGSTCVQLHRQQPARDP